MLSSMPTVAITSPIRAQDEQQEQQGVPPQQQLSKRPMIPSSLHKSMILSPPLKEQMDAFYSGFIECTVYREECSTFGKKASTYGMVMNSHSTILMAEKRPFSNYCIFDTTGGMDKKKHIATLHRYKNMYTLKKKNKENSVICNYRYDTSSLLASSNTNKKQTPARSLLIVLYNMHSTSATSSKENIYDTILLSSIPPIELPNGMLLADYGGRVTAVSKKNMQLQTQLDGDMVAQFGRVGADAFCLDYKSPMSALQAFGFALVQMDF